MKPNPKDEVLERNVTTLLESGGEPPRLGDAARARIRAELVAAHGVVAAPRSRWRSPLVAVGLGLAATAAAALIVTSLIGGGDRAPDARDGGLADGTTWITEPGAKVTQLGARRVRVEGAALLDVAPGKGTFVVETARGRIEVLGTRFLVTAEPDRTTAAVVRGRVKLATSEGEVLLHAGEQGVAEPGRPPSRGPAPRLSSLVSWAKAARKRDEHAMRPLRNGTLFARDPNNPRVPESPLPIAKLAVDVVVEDQVARVALDQTFHNPATQVREGMYRFAIPPDASLQRLAMYVNGTLNESAVVERQRARRIYEEIVYRRLDPALLEWAGTGRLALRVYPLPARQDKRLLLAYTQSLPRLYDDWSLSVPLPEVDLPVGELTFDVRVRGCANCEVTSPSHDVTVTRTGEDAVVSYRERGARIGDSLVLHVRDQRREPIIAEHQDAGGEYLLVRARPELPRAAKAYRPRTWVILNDVSASRGPMELRAQADVVDGFLRELDEDDRVAVIAFDVMARRKLEPTRVDDVDRRAVRAALADEGGVGATNFTAALAAATQALAGVAPEDAMIVYLGDGVITTGAKKLDALRDQLVGKAQFIGVGIGDGPDVETLESLAAATGGYATTIDLADDVGWRVFDLVAALHTTRVTGLSAKLVDASGALVPATAYLDAPQLADGEELELVAKLAGGNPPAAVILSGTVNGAAWQQEVALTGPPHAGGYLPRLWAQRHIDARMLAKHDAVIVPPCGEPAAQRVTRSGPRPAPAANVCPTEAELREQRDEAIRKEVVGLGKAYFLLSRHTSLLVLENDAMYKQYGVTKGAGDTWAPYKVPAKIPVVAWTPPAGAPADVADDAVLVRSPLRVFYDHGYLQGGEGWFDAGDELNLDGRVQRGAFNEARQSGVFGARRGDLGLVLGTRASGPKLDKLEADPAGSAPMAEQKAARESERDEDDRAPLEQQARAKRQSITTGEMSGLESRIGLGRFGTIGHGSGTGSGYGVGGGGLGLARVGGGAIAGPLVPQRFGYPTDTAFDDLTAFIPALLPDGADAMRAELEDAAGGTTTHPIDDGARRQLASARRALPAGVYRWDDFEIAIDGARRIGWRRTTGADLAETSSFDGTTWTRRYAELGIDVTRAVAEDDLALALAYMPLWIAEPAHYARWFEVGMQGAREVTLSRAPAIKGGKAELAYVLVFDDRDHLVAIRDHAGDELLRVTWGASGPTAARMLGRDLAVGFTGQAIGDAATWAHGSAPAGVGIELPGRLPAYWQGKLAKLAAGSPQWRHVQGQHMVSLAATGNRGALWAAFDALRTSGGIAAGDLVLASGAIATSTTDAQMREALATHADHPVARYLAAARAYGKAPAPERLAAQTQDGLVGALWTVREITALLQAGKHVAAVDRLVALGNRAFDLRLIGVATVSQRYQVKVAEIARAWDSVAVGDYKNIARAHAAQALANRGSYDAAADRIAALVAELDLAAAPPNLANMVWQVRNSRRGQAGWQLVWATWRERVLAGESYEHVMALMPLAGQHPADVPAILARAAELAKDDVDRLVRIARLATQYGQAAWAEALIEPLVKSHPTRTLHQLVAGMMIRQGRTAEALAHLEAAQAAAAADEAVSLATVRSELGQIIQTARQLAVQSSGQARDAAVQRALGWATRWRAIDPGNPQIDQQLGELLLAVGNETEAWRQLSSVIERDPMDGAGYQIVAEAFERQGRVAEAVDYWHQAVIIDQTNPTHRLRKAQALIALGRTAEGDAILAEIARRTWHDRWQGIAWQAESLLERGKQQPSP